MHEYLRDTLVYRYTECKSCANRTEFTCIKCSFCWSCHWKMEQIERIDLHSAHLPLVQGTKVIRNYSQAVIEENRQHKQLFQKLSPTITTVIDVYGEVAEPICDYLRCHHRLSVHGLGTSKCKCRHPQNITVGVS